MKRQIELSARWSRGVTVGLCLLAAFALLAASARSGLAADEFQNLVNQIPRSANAVVLLNLEKAKNSPLGLKEGWEEKIENAFAAGAARVPPQAKRFVMASQIDFEFMEPLWEAAVMDLDEEISLKTLAKARGGTLDTIEGLPAVLLPNDTYLVQLGPKTLAGMGPGNRQTVVRWIRDIRKPTPPPISAYLQKAAVYSDEAGSEVIMALDLEGVMSFERVAKYLNAHQKEFDEWQAKNKLPLKMADVASLLSNVEGIRIGVRVGEQQSSKIAVDLHADATAVASFAKPLLLQALSDKGAMIEDFQSWTAQVKGSEISLAGTLSSDGRRRLLSLVNSPVQAATLAKAPSVSPGDLPGIEAKKNRDYFRTIVSHGGRSEARHEGCEEPRIDPVVLQQIRQADPTDADPRHRRRAPQVQRHGGRHLAPVHRLDQDHGDPIRRPQSASFGRRLRGRFRVRRLPHRRLRRVLLRSVLRRQSRQRRTAEDPRGGEVDRGHGYPEAS